MPRAMPGDAEGDDAGRRRGRCLPRTSAKPSEYIRPMGAPLAPLAGQVLRNRTPQRYATRVCALSGRPPAKNPGPPEGGGAEGITKRIKPE